MFKSHLISLVLFAAIVSILMAFLRHDDMRKIWIYALKHFACMVGGVTLFSWFMRIF